MNLKALFRSSSAMAALPLGVALSSFYYIVNAHKQIEYWPYAWAPTLVEQPLEVIYAVAYATVSAAAAWQAARVKEAGAWQLAPYRPRWQVIGLTLSPVVAVGWAMMLVPIIAAFGERPTWPTLGSLAPLVLGLVLCVAHAVIGFTVGRRLHPILSVPIMSVVTFVVVGFSISRDNFLYRWVSGEYYGHLGYGESATWTSILAEMLPTIGIAAAAAMLWARINVLLRLVIGIALVWSTTAVAVQIADGWNFNPPLHVGVADTSCAGSRPEVCVPAAASSDLSSIDKSVDRTFAVLSDYGLMQQKPEKVEDAMSYGRFVPRSTARTAYVPLSTASHAGRLSWTLVEQTAHLGCDATPEAKAAAEIFVLDKLGGAPSFEQIRGQNPYWSQKLGSTARAEVAAAMKLSTAQQKRWMRDTVRTGCQGAQ